MKEVIDLAIKMHEGQVDKLGKPYIDHLFRVGFRGKSVSEMKVGILHDIIEDTDMTLSELKRTGLLSNEELDAIDHLTRKEGETYFDYINRVTKNELATKVKLNDLRDNLDLTRFDEVKEEHLSLLNRYLKAYDILRTSQQSDQ